MKNYSQKINDNLTIRHYYFKVNESKKDNLLIEQIQKVFNRIESRNNLNKKQFKITKGYNDDDIILNRFTIGISVECINA